MLVAAEATAIDGALDELSADFTAGRFVLDDRFEDGHSAIEAFLTERLGDAGKKVHTGRSRNDQVLVALRLYVREALAQIEAGGDRGRRRVPRSRRGGGRRADARLHAPSARRAFVGGSLACWVRRGADRRRRPGEATARWMDACPLGTAAGYGVNLPLDRQGVSDELGFARLLVNPVYAQNSRGKLELQALGALLQALFDVRRFAWDLSLYTTAEFAFVKLRRSTPPAPRFMPNKKNPDVVELLRASPSVVLGAMAEIESLLSLPSGYHRDLQATKGPVLRALSHGVEAIGLVPELVRQMELDKARMRAAISPDLYATDVTVELAMKGVPFRTAYRQVADSLGALAARTPEESLAARVSPGAPGHLMLGVLRERLAALG